MTTENMLVGAKPVGLPDMPDTISDSEDGSPDSARIPKATMPDSLRILKSDMGKLTPEFCSYDGDSDKGLKILQNGTKLLAPPSGPYGGAQENPEKPSELDDVRTNTMMQLFNSFILLVNEPKRDWCKGGIGGGGWPYRGSSTNAPGYTLNKGLWAMTKVFPWQDSDTFSFCEVHNDHLQTAREELPDEVRNMIEKQAEAYGFKDFDESTKLYVSWEKQRIEDFNSKLDACVNTMKGTEKFVKFGDKRYDLKDFCVDTMRMVSPGDKADDKPAGGVSRWGGSPEETEKTPVGSLKVKFDERLLDIPWNRWVHREAFCKEATDTWAHKAVGLVADALALAIPFVTWGGRLLIIILAEKTLIRGGKGIGKFIDKVGDGWKKLGEKVKTQKVAEIEKAALEALGRFDLSKLDGGAPLSVQDIVQASRMEGLDATDTSSEAVKVRETAERVARALREFEAANRARLEVRRAAERAERR